jgi:bisphosphoglycerate-dependent phosphoglycerate mutase
VDEAIAAGKLLKEKGFVFDVAHTSILTRALSTYHNIAA